LHVTSPSKKIGSSAAQKPREALAVLSLFFAVTELLSCRTSELQPFVAVYKDYTKLKICRLLGA